VRDWVFDLDNTLYPPRLRLFDQIEARMTAYVARELKLAPPEADRLRHQYYRLYGTTLAGLMHEHDLDPLPYLHEVHEIDLGHVPPAPDLAAAIGALSGRRWVYTNGSAPYARRVLEARGLDGLFDGVFGVEDAGFHQKHRRAAIETVFAPAGITPATGAMFEDDPRNLSVPHEMGMRTVLVTPGPSGPDAAGPRTASPRTSGPRVTDPHATDPDAPHIHHRTHDLAGFLRRLI